MDAFVKEGVVSEIIDKVPPACLQVKNFHGCIKKKPHSFNVSVTVSLHFRNEYHFCEFYRY